MYGSRSNSGYTAGPPQPEWRLPPNSQRQPAASPSTSAAPPPPPPPPPAYSPSMYGPMAGASAVNTSASVSPVTNTTSWGVRYNQQHHEAPPPLPPRPPAVQSPVLTSPNSNKPLPMLPAHGQSPPGGNFQQWTSPLIPPPYTTQPATSPISPVASPVPPQANPHSSFSYNNHYDPRVPSPVPAQASNVNYPVSSPGLSQSASPQPSISSLSVERPLQHLPAEQNLAASATGPPPVPPKSPLITATSSALGPGTPSDWEHLGPGLGDIDDTEVFQSRRGTPAQSNAAVEPPSSGMLLSELPADELPPSVLHSTKPHSSNTTVSPGEVQSAQPTNPNQQSNISPLMQSLSAEDPPDLQPLSTNSPISTHTAQENQEPLPPPVRVDTAVSSYSSASAAAPTESIDGVIEAWTRPISPEKPENSQQSSGSKPRDPPPKRKPSPIEIQVPKTDSGSTAPQEMRAAASTEGQSQSSQDSIVRGKSASPQPKALDSYDDLDPWFQSSLARYVTMLRTETVADSDEERYKIFTAFIAKETKLREILYNIELDNKSEEVTAPQSAPVSQQPKEKSPYTSSPIESGLIPVESEIPETMSSDIQEDWEEGQYSPGGRPILPTINTPASQGLQRSASNPTGLANALKLARAGTPAADSQIKVPRSTSVPPVMNEPAQRQGFGPLTTNPPQAIYTPLRYTEGPQRGSDKLSFDRPAYQAYSALRQASAESGRVMSNAPASSSDPPVGNTSPTPAPHDHDETFIGLIREKSVAYKKIPRRRSSPPPPLPMSLRQGRPDGPITELRTMVSTPLAKHSESPWHATTRKELEKYPDNFCYLQSTLNGWQVKAKIRREKLDKERMQRQDESEKQIDGLFNDKEIGYADINVLEEEYRQKEARAQLAEERRELEDFINNVFKPLDERLNGEISSLRAQYDSALKQLDHENGKIKESGADKYNLSHTMKMVNDIYQKLEIRYQRRLGIALDRERRRKRTERRPLVFMGDSPALKKLDTEFDMMEKRNILEAAKDRDERANRLMDSFDNAIMHGLGENQSLLDEVALKVKKIDSETIRSSGLSDSEVEQVLKSTFTFIESLRQDSEYILHNFGVADSVLNDADYSVSITEARYANADAEVFRRLEAEKKKEDAKIQDQLKSKLESLRDGPANITTKINELLRDIGKEPVVENAAPIDIALDKKPDTALLPARPPTAGLASEKSNEDLEHKERIQKALEAAKKRNASRNA